MMSWGPQRRLAPGILSAAMYMYKPQYKADVRWIIITIQFMQHNLQSCDKTHTYNSPVSPVRLTPHNSFPALTTKFTSLAISRSTKSRDLISPKNVKCYDIKRKLFQPEERKYCKGIGYNKIVNYTISACVLNRWCATNPMGFKGQRDFRHVGWYLHCKQAKSFVNVIQHGDGDVTCTSPIVLRQL
jgi:hypothetical protein